MVRKRLFPRSKTVGGVKARRLAHFLQADVSIGMPADHLTIQQCVNASIHYLAEARCMYQGHREMIDGRWKTPCVACEAWTTERVHDIISEPVPKVTRRKK